MDLSVIVPTLNARDELADCLDALAEHVPQAEVIVVNGPSADGTTGMVQKRADVDVLVELADRTINAARNAGIDRATGEVIAFVNHTLAIDADWPETVTERLASADVVSGPTTNGTTADPGIEQRSIAGRRVTYFNPGNVAFQREPLDSLDGFDEYLQIGGARDLAHRLATTGYRVVWDANMTVSQELETDGGGRPTEWGWKYRSLSYRLLKNYGVRPTVLRRILGHASRDAYTEFKGILGGEKRPSQWFGTGRDVLTNIAGGAKDGVTARRFDRTERRNPYGRSSRADRAVTVYDWREQ